MQATTSSCDFVDEGKLLLFIKEEVAESAPRTGARLTQERKRRRGEKKLAVDAASRGKKRRVVAHAAVDTGTKGGAEAVEVEVEVEEEEEKEDAGYEGEIEEHSSELTLKYNTIRGYISAINELWAHQTSSLMHSAPHPQGVALKALKASVARQEHRRRRSEYVDRGVDRIKDGYTAVQVPDVARAAFLKRRVRSIEAALRIWVDFLLRHSMLLPLGNRLVLELPDVFAMPLPKEGPPGSDAWCLVAQMDHGEFFLCPFFFLWFPPLSGVGGGMLCLQDL